MSFRSVVLGLLAALALCSIGYFNDQILHNSPLVGDYLPFSIFGLLLLFLLLLNPLIARVKRLSAAELALITCLALMVGWIPGMGFMRYFNNVLVMPHRFAVEQPGWQASPLEFDAADIRKPHRAQALLAALAAQHPGSGLQRLSADPAALATSLNAALTNATLAQLAFRSPDCLPVNLRARNDIGSSSPSDQAVAVRSFLDHHLGDAVEPRWPGLLEHVDPTLLVSTNSDFATVVDGFRSGLGGEQSHVSPSAIPVHAWLTPYSRWLPGLLLFCAAMLGMALVVHRQWAHHEHLPYPTMSFVEALLPRPDGTLAALFRSRLFWITFLLIAGIHLYNYTARSWDYYRYLAPVRLRFGFGPIAEMFPILNQGNAWVVFTPRIFFIVVGIAYFLASDVSLSLAISPLFYFLILGIAAQVGVSFGGNSFMPDIETFIYGGGYLGLFLVILWTGRHYYRRILARSLALPGRPTEATEQLAIWGGRITLVATGLLIAWLVQIGVTWPLAIAYVVILLATQLVMARILAEGGVIWFGPAFVPSALLWGFFGTRGVGPDQILLLGLVSSVLVMGTSVTLMPVATTALQLLERTGAPLGRSMACGAVALLLGLTTALGVTLYTQYDRGAARINDGWASQEMPRRIYESNLIARQRLDAQGLLHAAPSEGVTGVIQSLTPTWPAIIAMLITVGLVLLFTYFRHRYSRWPLHPILFLGLGSWSSCWLCFSFFLGWILKSLVTRYGGVALYLRLKPLMIGMIAGEMVGVTIPAIISSIYYLVTGEFGIYYKLIPH